MIELLARPASNKRLRKISANPNSTSTSQMDSIQQAKLSKDEGSCPTCGARCEVMTITHRYGNLPGAISSSSYTEYRVKSRRQRKRPKK